MKSKDVVSKEEVTFEEAFKALTEKKCTSIQANDDCGFIALSGRHNLSYPVLCFVGTESPMPAEYFLRPFRLVNEKPEMVRVPTVNTYLANESGFIVDGPFNQSEIVPLKEGFSLVNVAGVDMVPAPPKKKKIKHVITDVSWHQGAHVEKIERLGANGFVKFPFYPCGPKSGLITPLIGTLGDKRCTLTIEYEE